MQHPALHLEIIVLWTFILVVAATSTGLVKTEQQLVEALSSQSPRIVLGRSITITKELPPVGKSVTLVGHSKACKQASCYIDAQQMSRHISVLSAGSLSVYNLELRNGKSSDDDGGSILVRDGGSLELNTVTFTDNNVPLFSVGGAVCARNGSFAGIYRSTFTRNVAGFGGGVGVSETSKADIRNSVFEHNVATLSGGGLELLAKSSALLVENTFENNTASLGGATTGHDSLINNCGGSFIRNVGSLDGPNVMSEGGSNITVCKLGREFVTGIALEDCAPCSALAPPGVRGDPHIRGPHGETFDFHGTPDRAYCLISDRNLELNMKIMAGYITGSTYIKELGLVYGNQTVRLSSTSPTLSEHQGSLSVNTEEMPMESGTWSFPNDLMVSRTRNEVTVEVRELFRMRFTIVKARHRAPSNFLNLKIGYFKPSEAVDGIFGQLYNTGTKSMPFEGTGKFKSLSSPERFLVRDLLYKD